MRMARLGTKVSDETKQKLKAAWVIRKKSKLKSFVK
jgi:hypothetical protein